MLACAGAHAPAQAQSGNGTQTVLELAREMGARPTRAPLAFALQDDARLLNHPEDLEEIRELGFTHLRISAHWNALTRMPRAARRPAFRASNPSAYEQRKWVPLDRVVRAARAHGLKVMIDVAFFAPRWATRGTAAGDPRPRDRIDPPAFRDFALAVARRYSGRYEPPGARARLPRVDVLTLYNEPNLPVFWRPQRRVGAGGRISLASPHDYRRLSNLTYSAIKRERPETTVLVGALASGPAWDPRLRNAGIPGMRFLREMACVDDRLEPLSTPDCRSFWGVLGDGLAIHPYAFGLPPDHFPSGARVDNVTMGNLDHLAALTAALVYRGRLAPRLADLYVTEFGYLTGPARPGARPLRNPFPKVSLARQAAWLNWAHQLAWQVPQVKMFSQFLVRDTLCGPLAGAGCLDWSSGFRFAGGAAKPARAALAAGLHTRTLPDGFVLAWIRLGSAAAQRRAILAYEDESGSRHPLDRGYVQAVSGNGPDGILALRLYPPPGLLRLIYADGG